jgi:hypothetical protein
MDHLHNVHWDGNIRLPGFLSASMTEVENLGEILYQVYVPGGSFRLVPLFPATSSNT